MSILKLLVTLVVGIVTFSSNAVAQEKKVRVQMGWAFPSTTGLLGPTQTRLVETLRTVSDVNTAARDGAKRFNQPSLGRPE